MGGGAEFGQGCWFDGKRELAWGAGLVSGWGRGLDEGLQGAHLLVWRGYRLGGGSMSWHSHQVDRGVRDVARALSLL